MLKSLQNDLKSSYNSRFYDIPRMFYNPVLSNSKKYNRVSGYFSSKALSLYAIGLDRLADNDGSIKLIISFDISEEDFYEIKEGYRLRSEEEYLTEDDLKRIGNLAYLIANGNAEVKFGFVNDGLFHTKWGIFENEVGEKVYFNGSINETKSGIENNYDSFDVDFSWDISPIVRERIKQKSIEFDKLWNDEYEQVHVVDAKDIVYDLTKDYNEEKIQKIQDINIKAVIMDKNDDNFFLVDKTNESVIEIKSFKSKLEYYVDEEKNYPFFYGDLDYGTVEQIIKIAKKQTEKNGYKFIISDTVEKFINNEKYTIDEYRKSSLTLKDDDLKEWKPEFKKFVEVVNNETDRLLKDTQLRAAFHMLTQKRSANFSVPGSGKTAMLLGVFAFLNSQYANKIIKKILVICPLNAFMSWRDEFAAVFNNKKELNVLTVHDSNIQGNPLAFENQWVKANLILVNYESLNKYQKSLIKCLETTDDTMIVFDEVHRIKGIQGKRAKSALAIADKTDYRYVLTGTPIPNSYLDIYNFLHILFKNEYNSFFGFDTTHLHNPDEYMIEKKSMKSLNLITGERTKMI